MPEPKLPYIEACHAVQTGVAFEQSHGSQCGSPKHLRTGINLSKCDQAALAKLLIAKGVFTEREYETAVTEETNAEVDRYEQRAGGRINFR